MAEGRREDHTEEPDAFERPFKKTLVDLYDYLALGVASNVTTLIALAGAASVGFLLSGTPGWAPLAASLAGVVVLVPALAYGMATLALAVARRQDPSFQMLFAGFGRPYPRALAYLALGLGGAALVSFMVWFWGHAPVSGSPFEVAIGAMWLGFGVLAAGAHLLGWPVLVLSEGRPVYTLRLVLALLAVAPRAAAGHLACCLVLAVVVLAPVLVQWRGLGAGACVMFTVFIAVFAMALVSANVALRLIDVLAERKEADGLGENTCQTEEDRADGGCGGTWDPRGRRAGPARGRLP